MILKKRQRSPLFPDFNLKKWNSRKSGNNSDRKNILPAQRVVFQWFN
ncbi:hypothetical protein [Paenibacillus spongiae]|uniref:Uncharacterized protein n=1 Tax=Paenibacillus spongiae TaxID=2909671 RepID=A0ABY5SJM8_9BACL|nr:hypothetical protein [Paenibacillus spongiae]UVI32808.1 hypothetical protein L1F29_13670 [Paenibacillus spongiae]